MDEKIRKIKALRHVKITKLANLLQAAENAQSVTSARNFLKSMYTTIAEIKTEFQKQQSALINNIFGKEDEFKDAVSVMSQFDKTFYTIKSTFNTLFKESDNKVKNEDAIGNANLPSINLIKFKADIEALPTFLELFNSIVHQNPKLSPIEKFSYLISSLEGPPP